MDTRGNTATRDPRTGDSADTGEGLLNPKTLAAYLATRIPLEALSALYLLVEDERPAFIEALAERIEAGAQTATDYMARYGSPGETHNDEHYGRVVAARRAADRRREALTLDDLNKDAIERTQE